MPPDPKTPEERLSEAKEKAHRALRLALRSAYKEDHNQTDVAEFASHDSIDHLAAVAVLVGRIQQHIYECQNCSGIEGVPDVGCEEHDRLLAELDEIGKGERG